LMRPVTRPEVVSMVKLLTARTGCNCRRASSRLKMIAMVDDAKKTEGSKGK
jgi:hypothetical protein